jgi:hypothetical protein
MMSQYNNSNNSSRISNRESDKLNAGNRTINRIKSPDLNSAVNRNP